MDNVTLRTALVTKYISKVTESDQYQEEMNASLVEATKEASEFINSLNPDKRSIAIGRSDEIWRWDTQSSIADEWTVLTRECSLHMLALLAAAAKPQKALITNPDAASLLYSWKKRSNSSTDITFVNNINLYFYERFYRHSHDVYGDFSYSVIDLQDLEQEVEQYDFVYAYVWDVVSDLDYLELLVNALMPGGTLLINVTNLSGKLYTDEFESHPHYDMHEFLKNQPNSTTVHNSAFYGTTVFIKH